MALVAVIDDLIFRAKVEAAADRLHLSLTLARDSAAAVQAMRRDAASLLVVDLNHALEDPFALIQTVRQASPGAPIIGYCAHIQGELRARALEAGCTEVLPRSVFVARLGRLLAEFAGAGGMSADELEWRERLVREGLRPARWANGPDAVYGEHAHPYGKVLVVVSGSITFTITDGPSTRPAGALPGPPSNASGERQERVVTMRRGDRLELPPQTPHSAVVGADGVVCLEAHVRATI